MKATRIVRRALTLAALFSLAMPWCAQAQVEDEGDVIDDPPPFEVPDVSEADFPFSPPADFAGFVPIHQLEMEEHPDGQTAAQRRRALRAVPKKSVIQPRAITAGARVLGWHPYWAEEGDYLSYDYSNLTHIAYFSAEVGTSGTISSIHGWNTDPVVETAHANGVKVILTATLFGESSNHALLTNSAACHKLATNLVQKVTARGGDGICIDFESVGSWSGATKALTSFMSNLVAAARASGTNLEVSICLPSVDWYADFAVGEYEKIGVDYSIIMGYDYYYAGSATPGPVAPLYSSAQWQGASSWCSVDYSTRYYLNKMTNAAHLMLAVPYYGRRWKATTTNLGASSAGSSYSAAVTYPNAAANAETYGRHWDTNSSVPYYTYKSGTNAYQCFYDDAESLGLKYDYAKSKGLGGIGIWCLTHAPESEELWNLLGDELGNYTPPGVTIPSTSPGPAAIASGVDADSALLSWTPATEDPTGYVVQSAPSAEGLANGWWEPASGLFSNSFSTAEGWGSFTNTGTTNVTVSGSTWTVHYSRLRAALTSYSDPGYVFLDANSSYIQTPPIHEMVTQVTARVRAGNSNYLDYRKVSLLASTDSGASWQTLGNCPANSFTNIIDYPFSCSLQSASGVVLMVSNTTDSTISGQTVILHQLTADYATSNKVTAPNFTVTDTCATNLTNLAAPTYYRVRNASSTNWSDIVGVLPGMVPSALTTVPAATNIDLSWDAAPGAAAYQVDVASGPYTNWTSTCPAASLGTNQFLSGQTWCYTGTVRTVTTSANLGAGPGYCSTAKYAGHYLAGYPGQALQSYDFPLYGATCANLSFSNCPWNASNSTVGVTCSTLRVYYRLDQGPWNFLGECRAKSKNDEDWSGQSYDLPYLDGETLAVKIVAPYAERHADSTSGSLRGAGLKNVRLSFSGTTGRYCDANRPEGYPKTVTAPSDTIEGLTPETPYWIRVQALTENTRSVWVETTATTTEDTGGDQPSAEDTPVTTTWDFTIPEGWSKDESTFTGTTNVNGHAWDLTYCSVYPDSDAGGDTGYISLFNPKYFSHAIAPAFHGVVTQVTTILRAPSYDASQGRYVTLMASTDGGASFTNLATYSLTAKNQNFTNTTAFSPALDGGDFGVIFCASNSGTAGTIHFRRLTIEGTSTAPEEPDADSYSPFGASTAEQPHGALSGIVLYLSAGHGFTANASTNAWAAGRGISCGMVEDFGNLDQLNYFALQAWKAGATIVPMRPLGHQTNEIVIDNVDTAASLASRVTYGGNWGNTSQSDYYYGKAGEVGYRWADTCATGTTAWASYRPNLPAAGEYPVYVWARPGSDRVPQLYRIHHAGGVTDVRVDHRQVGNGWVWLGNFWFDAGTNGCVNISNFSPDEEGTVIADAVRFGNGMGDISRGSAGKSGYARELEGARYWTQRMVMDSQGLSATIYDSTGKDQDDNVSAPNRMAYAMCRTNKNDSGWTPERWRRLYLSFHSNASGTQRGCMGLYDSRLSAGTALAGQTNLARCIANAIVTNMTHAHSAGIVATAWQQDCARVLKGTYGEIYNGGIYNKMDNTIAEVAFHDKELDAAILKSATGREWLARSCLRGVLRHFVTRYASDANLTVREISAPAAPTAVAATNSGLGCVTVSWQMPLTNQLYPDAHTGFVIYVSTNGYAFGNPVAITSQLRDYAHKFTDLPTGTPYYFRVCAVNAGGESLSSPVAGAGLSNDGSTADVLVVDGFRRNDGSLSPTRYYANNLNGNVTLVRPKMINSFDYVKEHGNAIAAAGKSFDFMDATRLNATVLARYPKVVWCLGTESTADETFSYEEQQLLATYLANHGALFVSGSEIGWDLDYKGSAADKAFMTNWLHCAYAADDSGTGSVKGKSSTYFSGLTNGFTFNHNETLDDIYAARYPDVLVPVGDAFIAATYGTGTNGAIIACSNSICRTVVMGFPFETVTDATQRNKLMKKVLDFFEENTISPSWIGDTAYTTGLGGEVAIDLKTQVTGYPSPAVTLSGSLDSRTGEAVNESAYIIAEDGFIFDAGASGIGEGTYTFTFLASNGTGGDIYQDVIITVGNSPIWRAIPDILVDLDAEFTDNLYKYVSGDPIPDLALDTNHTAAAEATYEFDANEGFLYIISTSTPTTNVFTFTASNAYGTASVTFTNAIRRLDTDDDGIPDWWAIKYFGGATSCNPNLDPDGDGYTNYQEYILGTDPNDASSYFTLQSSPGETDGETQLYWASTTGTTYSVRSSTNLLGGIESFTTVVTNITADSSDIIIVPVLPDTPNTFYLIRVD